MAQSATFTNEQKIEALKSALEIGIITQQEYNTKIIALNNPVEPFSWLKFVEGLVSSLNPTLWAKTFATFFNIRTIILVSIIVGASYWWGESHRLPTFNLQGQAITIPVSATENVQFTKSGVAELTDKQGHVIKKFTVKDIPQIDKVLKPVGLQLKPIAVAGLGMGASGASPEVGAGVSWFKFYNLEADAFATNKAIYPLGVSYRLEKFASGNTSVGLAGGLGYNGDKRVIVYVRWAF
jgi:hypothetical protein